MTARHNEMTSKEAKVHYKIVDEMPIFKLEKDKDDFRKLRYSGTYLNEEYVMLENYRLNEMFILLWN